LSDCARARMAATMLVWLALCTQRLTAASSVESDLAVLTAVGKDGQGHVQAQQAMSRLRSAGAAELPAMLKALDRAGPLAAEWIRNAFETVADRALRQRQALPAAELQRFVLERAHAPRARRLAYEWLVKVDPSASGRLVPQMLLDPATEFRRDAVALRIAQASKVDPKSDRAKAIRLYREAFSGAVHDDQVKSIVQALAGLGEKVDIAAHFAFLTCFSVIGPFDNRGGIGLDAVYPPEKEIRLEATYEGQLGKVSWRPFTTTQEYGIVDIAHQIKPYKGAVMYALAKFDSPRDRALELRLATQNAWKIWVNGEFLFSRLEYHRGSTFDQYRVPVRMRAGHNAILLKLCQDEENEDWAQTYQFQLRVCDRSGAGVRSQAPPVSVSGGPH
jgi:hypothetical protein